eukprot:1728702-Rhodomonas_salina.1
MDGWLDGWMDGWLDGWMDGAVGACLVGSLARWLTCARVECGCKQDVGDRDIIIGKTTLVQTQDEHDQVFASDPRCVCLRTGGGSEDAFHPEGAALRRKPPSATRARGCATTSMAQSTRSHPHVPLNGALLDDVLFADIALDDVALTSDPALVSNSSAR